MVKLTGALSRLFGSRRRQPEIEPGAEVSLDGASVVAQCEAMLGSVPADDPSAALGLALSGARATCVIRGVDGEANVAAMRTAAGRQAPFVVHLFARAAPAHSIAKGTGHEALHALADTGAFVLVAQNVEEVAHLTVVARSVAERALVPGVVVMDDEEIARTVATVRLPPAELVRELAGRADDVVPCATRTQRLLFGKVRRRIPRWIDREHPALHGPVAGPESWALGAAGRRPWLLESVRPLIQEEFERLAQNTRRRFESTPAFTMDGADTILVAVGSLVETAKRVAARIREDGGPHIGVLGIRTLRPFPVAAVAEALKAKRRVLVLARADAPLAGDPPLTREIRTAIATTDDGRPSRLPRVVTAIAGAGGFPVIEEDLRAFCLDSREESDRLVYLGLEFLPEDPEHPKRQAFLDRLRRHYPEVGTLGRHGERTKTEAPQEEPVIPPAVRHLGRTDDHWDSLPRFWDQVGVLYREGGIAELSPDPHLALGAVPPFSSGFRDRSDEGARWPALDPTLCTGCGLCWTLCPDGAVTVAALGARETLDAGLEQARERGRTPDVLRSVLAKLASKTDARARAQSPATFADAARPAFDEVLEKASPPADRREALVAAFESVLHEIGELPLSRTAPFFDDAPKGKGAFVSLAVDPTVCKGCGVCVAACEPGALAAEEPSEQRRARDLGIRNRVAELPPPSSVTVDRVRAADGIGPAAALLLGPEGRSPMTGGDRAEPGSGARLVLRQVLAAAVSHLAPRQSTFLKELDDLRAKFAEEIRHGMLDGVPTDDLDAIARGLRVLGGPDTEVSGLIGRLEEACESDRIDTERMSALVEAAKDLADVRETCARAGIVPPALVIAGESLEWAASFPDNPFAGPVIFDAGRQAARIAHGLIEGVTLETARAAGRVRRARATLGQPLAPGAPEPPPWHELDDSEQARTPPVVLVLDRAAWSRQELSTIDALFGSRRPVVVIVLSETAKAGPSPALPPMARGDVFTLQSSIAFPDHLVMGLADAFASHRPAFIHVLAPSPSAAGVDAERLIAEARRPVDRRAFPLFRRAPDAQGGATRIDLRGNPDSPASDANPADLAAWEAFRELEGCAVEPESPLVDAAAKETRAEMERRLTGRLLALSGWSADQGSSS